MYCYSINKCSNSPISMYLCPVITLSLSASCAVRQMVVVIIKWRTLAGFTTYIYTVWVCSKYTIYTRQVNKLQKQHDTFLTNAKMLFVIIFQLKYMS